MDFIPNAASAYPIVWPQASQLFPQKVKITPEFNLIEGKKLRNCVKRDIVVIDIKIYCKDNNLNGC